jgi:antitoxin PrlF
MPSATITSKGQITVPVQVRNAMGLEAGDRIEFVELEKHKFAIVPATRSIRELEGRYYDKQRKPVTIEDMNAAIAREASKSR